MVQPTGRGSNAEPHVRQVQWTFDGQTLTAIEGQSVAAALLATGRRAWSVTGRRGEPRGLFCGMGICFDCLVRIDGRPNVRACQTPVSEGLRVETGGSRPDPEVAE